VELVRSGGGVFEIRLDGELVFSKKQTGRHVHWDELRVLLGGK
jgi:selT/selW/selH-like putative selenoprotein